MNPLLVRTDDKMVFQINRNTLEAKTIALYDPYCYSDPRVDADYMEYHDWIEAVNGKWSEERISQYPR
jgi:hypothetical protein